MLESVERTKGTPAAAAALATAISASGWASPWAAIGAIAHGTAAGEPSRVVDVSTFPTSTRTRGTKRTARQAASLSASEISSQAPEAT